MILETILTVGVTATALVILAMYFTREVGAGEPWEDKDDL